MIFFGSPETFSHLSQRAAYSCSFLDHDYKRSQPARQTIKICRAEACQAVGAEDLIKEAEKSFGVSLNADGTDVALEASYCLGNCALGPAVMIDDYLYGRIDVKTLKKISMKHREGSRS